MKFTDEEIFLMQACLKDFIKRAVDSNEYDIAKNALNVMKKLLEKQ